MCGCMQDAGVELDPMPKMGLYDLGPMAVGFGGLVSPQVDVKEMSATVTISTSRRDRQRERILADGLDIEQYKRNPVVLWEHGLDSAIPLPIGKSKSPSGDIAIRKSGDAWEATCWFSQTSPMAYQVFGLVAEDIVKAASIQALPYPASVTREVDPEDGLPNVVIGRAELVEWSWGRMGINPDAVRKCLDRGRIGEHNILPALIKSLSAMAAPKKLIVPGITLPAGTVLKTTQRLVACDSTGAPIVGPVLGVARYKTVNGPRAYVPKVRGLRSAKPAAPVVDNGPRAYVPRTPSYDDDVDETPQTPRPPSGMWKPPKIAAGAGSVATPKAPATPKMPSLSSSHLASHGMADEHVRNVLSSKNPMGALKDMAYSGSHDLETSEKAHRAYSALQPKRTAAVGAARYAVKPPPKTQDVY